MWAVRNKPPNRALSNCGLKRDRGSVRTSMTRFTPWDFSKWMNSPIGRVECPIVKTKDRLMSTCGLDQRAALLIQRVQQLPVRLREGRNAVRLQLFGDGVNVQAQPGGAGKRGVILARVRRNAVLRAPVIAKCIERRRRYSRHRLRRDQAFEVEDVGI